jgi:damage-control phosphatase, subfamily III
VLITNTIADVEQTMRESRNTGLQAEGKRIVRELIELRHDMDNDRPLRYDAPPKLSCLTSTSPIPDDKQPNLQTYNDELRRLNRPTWRNVSWLYSECYLYRYTFAIHSANLRLLKSTFASTVHWTTHDPFSRQKDEAFRSSKQGVLELADHFRSYATNPRHDEEAQRKLVFVTTPPLT